MRNGHPGPAASGPTSGEGYDHLPVQRGLLPQFLQFFQLFDLVLLDLFEFLDLGLEDRGRLFPGCLGGPDPVGQCPLLTRVCLMCTPYSFRGLTTLVSSLSTWGSMDTQRVRADRTREVRAACGASGLHLESATYCMTGARGALRKHETPSLAP